MTRPIWVQVGLFGIKSRRTAVAFGWISLVTSPALSFLIYRIFSRLPDPLAIGIALLGLPIGGLCAWWYFASMKWVDRFDKWH